MEQKYNVGDVVKIAYFEKCVFGINSSMLKFIGREVQIVNVIWRKQYGAYQYTIAEDSGEWWWDQQCFEPLICEELPMFEPAESLDSLLV